MIEIRQINGDVVAEVLAMYSEEAVTQVLANIAEGARAKWIRLAQERLYTSRGDYSGKIQKVEVSHLRASIALVGVLANIVENGMPETDMRDTLLGPGVPVAPPGQPGKRQGSKGADHFYRAIPFRHATPGTAGVVGSAMGTAYKGMLGEDGAKRLGKDVYAAAKALGDADEDHPQGGGTRSAPGQGVAYGRRLAEGVGGAEKLKDWHATDIYSGMIRQEKVYEDPKKKPQASYVTFRTISTEPSVDPRSWIRPASDGKHLAKDVSAHAARIAPMSFAAYVEGLHG